MSTSRRRTKPTWNPISRRVQRSPSRTASTFITDKSSHAPISTNAEHGEYVTGPKIVTAATKQAMRDALARIQSGDYAKEFILENRAGAPTLNAHRRLIAEHSIEQVGEKLRSMMPWIKRNKLVDQTRN